MDKGIDGCQIDMINHIKKEPGFPDLPNLKQLYVVPLWDYRMNVERINDLLSELKKETFRNRHHDCW
ncbi:hypothetical protein ACFQDF_16555 [Ectobacillus funiculus]